MSKEAQTRAMQAENAMLWGLISFVQRGNTKALMNVKITITVVSKPTTKFSNRSCGNKT